MELPVTAQGNRYVIVFQDFLTKWPLVFPAPDQKAICIARLLVDEILPFFGVPEALLSDRGTNLLAHVVKDVCQLLGITKLNTTAHHPQCDGMVERMNRTLKAMLRKHSHKFGNQWDCYLSGILWAYRNTPHESTQEKPSFLLFGVDLRSPTEAALLPTETTCPADVSEYREEVILLLSTARKLAVDNIRSAQSRYKEQYDKRSKPAQYKVGEWVFVRFPQEESGRLRKLSRPWHGPYRIVERRDPDVTVVKVYFPEDGPIQIHQLRVCPCPTQLPAGFYWYGGRRKSPGHVPPWLQRLLSRSEDDQQVQSSEATQDPPSEECVTNDDSVDGMGELLFPEVTQEDDNSNTDRSEVNDSIESSPQQTKPQQINSRYTLRNRIRPPQRLMRVTFEDEPS